MRVIAVAAAVSLLIVACGGDSGGTGADATDGGVETSIGTLAPGPGGSALLPDLDIGDELPPPDESDFTGRARVVNLWLDDAMETIEIDVWAGRTFTNGPVLLAEDLGFGEVTDYFSAPDGHSIIFTPAGSGPDGEEIGSMFNPVDGAQILAELLWDDGTSVPNRWEVDPDDLDRVPPSPSGPDEGILAIRAGQLIPWEDDLTDEFGGRSFYVGDSTGTCLPQTVEEEGFSFSIMGGTQPTYHRMAPGAATISFHRWPDAEECATEPVFEFEVDIAGGERTWVFVYTPDGETLDTLVLPIEEP